MKTVIVLKDLSHNVVAAYSSPKALISSKKCFWRNKENVVFYNTQDILYAMSNSAILVNYNDKPCTLHKVNLNE